MVACPYEIAYGLIVFVADGNKEGVARMLAAGASVDRDLSERAPPLVVATFEGGVAMVDFLTARGANVNVRTTHDSYFAPAEDTPLHGAVKHGNVDIVRLLLKAGANPNTGGAAGRLPLVMACSGDGSPCYLEIARELLEAGADPKRMDPEMGNGALHLAAVLGYVDIVELLASKAPETLSMGGSTQKYDTPLFLAAMQGKTETVSLLLSRGAMALDPVFGGGCVLSAAVVGEHEDVVAVLLAAGGLEAVGGPEVLTRALQYALKHGRARIIQALVNAARECHVLDGPRCRPPGMTWLHHAAEYSDPCAVSILLAAGADETKTDGKGLVPLEVIGRIDVNTLTTTVPCGKSLGRDPADAPAVRRALKRAPAFRANSWAWPTRADAVLPAATAPARVSLGVRALRPRGTTFFVKVLAR